MSCCWGGCDVHILKSPWFQVLRPVVIGSLWFPRVAGSLFCSPLQRFAAVVGRRVHFCFAIWPASPCILDRRRSCPAPVSPLSQQSHGAEETFLAQKGVREEGRQEEGEALGQAQREEARVEAPQEGWRRRVKQLYMVCVCVVSVFQVIAGPKVVVLGFGEVLRRHRFSLGALWYDISVRVPLAFIC